MNLNMITAIVLMLISAIAIFVTPNEALHMQIIYIIMLIYSSYMFGKMMQTIILKDQIDRAHAKLEQEYILKYRELLRKTENDFL